MYQKGLVEGLRGGATGAEVMKMYAVSRIMLNNWIPNLQASWVKEGPKLAQMALDAGCNDFMGTLINESISTSAGAIYGQRMAPREMRALIREMGRIPAERNTLYGIKRQFGIEPRRPLRPARPRRRHATSASAATSSSRRTRASVRGAVPARGAGGGVARIGMSHPCDSIALMR